MNMVAKTIKKKETVTKKSNKEVKKVNEKVKEVNNKFNAGNRNSGAKQETITKDMRIGDIVMGYPETYEVFMKHGLHCIGCAAAHFENLEQGCAAHGIDIKKIVADLNAAIAKK